MISVVTVNYKTKDELGRMLESLYAHHRSEDVEVLVVENASGDDLSALERRFPQADYFYPAKNLGFAGGCNVGISQASGDVIVLVNPDIVFYDDALIRVIERMRGEPGVGIAGIRLSNLDGSLQPCVWNFPRPSDQLMLLLKIPHLLGDIGPVARWKAKGFDYARTQDVDQVMGAFFCIDRNLLKEIGVLDAGFFMWYEEVDFCKRAKDAGWRVRYYADIGARHKRGASFDRVSTMRKQAMLRKSLRRYMRKHHGTGAWLLFTLLEPLFILSGIFAAIIKPK